MFHFDMQRLLEPANIDKTDIPGFVVLCLVMGAYRLFMCGFVLKRICKALKVVPAKQLKFIHRSFDMIHYISACILGTIAVSKRPYFRCFFNAIECGDVLTQTPEVNMILLEKIYYFMFTAYYIVDAFFIWTGNGTTVMIIHHVATLSMIVMSFLCNGHNIGITIMILHDWVDVPLYIGKVASYVKGWNKIADAGLVTMAIMYTWFRMINLPFVAYHTWHAALFKPVHVHLNLFYIAASILFVLLFCHVYWYWKIIKGAIRMFKKGEVVDTRSAEAEMEAEKKDK